MNKELDDMPLLTVNEVYSFMCSSGAYMPYNRPTHEMLRNLAKSNMKNHTPPANNKPRKCFIFYAVKINGKTEFGSCLTAKSPYQWVYAVNNYSGQAPAVEQMAVHYTLCNWKFISEADFEKMKGAGIKEM